MGLLVNPLNIFVYIPSLEERSVFEYSRMAFDVRYFGDVLRALDVVFGYIRNFVSGMSFESRLLAVENKLDTLSAYVTTQYSTVTTQFSTVIAMLEQQAAQNQHAPDSSSDDDDL